MIRVQLSSASGGPADFTVPYNPVYVEEKADYDVNAIPILHGSPVYQVPAYDGRPRILRWESNEVGDVNMASLLGQLRYRKGKVWYINFNDIDDLFWSWPSLTTWNKMMIIDIKTKSRRGGKLQYDSFEAYVMPIT